MSRSDVEQNGLPDIGNSFSDKMIRQAFIRKVYGLLSAQLLVTLGVIMCFIYVDGVKQAMQKNPIYLIIPAVLSIVFVLALVCCQRVVRKYPLNIIVLSLFTLCEAVLLGFVSAAYEPRVVLIAVATTAGLTIALTIFALQTKWDLTILVGSMAAILFAFVMFGFLMWFLPDTPVLRKVYAGVGVVIFGVYIVIDTQLMMGGNKRYTISPEDYVFATLKLYLDIINLFLELLQLFGRR